jgi:hypothetical protein
MRAKLEEALIWGVIALAVAAAVAIGMAGPADEDDPELAPPCGGCPSCARWREGRGTRPSPGS